MFWFFPLTQSLDYESWDTENCCKYRFCKLIFRQRNFYRNIYIYIYYPNFRVYNDRAPHYLSVESSLKWIGCKLQFLFFWRKKIIIFFSPKNAYISDIKEYSQKNHSKWEQFNVFKTHYPNLKVLQQWESEPFFAARQMILICDLENCIKFSKKNFSQKHLYFKYDWIFSKTLRNESGSMRFKQCLKALQPIEPTFAGRQENFSRFSIITKSHKLNFGQKLFNIYVYILIQNYSTPHSLSFESLLRWIGWKLR